MTPSPRPPATHIHVSEREVAHRWPDGQWDDRRWEDCAFDVAIEFVRALGRTDIPATHAEAERLRKAAGYGPSGGANATRVAAGLRARYGIRTEVVRGTALWTKLQPGSVASVAGKMGVFPLGHRLRRHDPPFVGAHQVTVFRLDRAQRVWWCDPLAPTGTYRGEWVSMTDFAAFVRALDGGHFVGPIAVRAPVAPAVLSRLRGYIANLAAIARPSAAQTAKLAEYRARLAAYLKRGG